MNFSFSLVLLSVAGIFAPEDLTDMAQDLEKLPADRNFSSLLPLSTPYFSSEHSISADTESLIRRTLQYSAAAYCIDLAIKTWACSFCRNLQNVDLISVQDSFLTGEKGYVAVDHNLKAIVVAFRGSSDIQNWVSDFTTAQTTFDVKDIGIQVHSGFLHYANGILPKLIPILQSLIPKYTNYSLIITGHSLGAAVATIASIQLQTALAIPWSSMKLVTFGEPRVGNLQFAQWMNTRNMTMLRVVNNRDIVPHVPPYSDGFVHHNQEIFLTSGLFQACTTTFHEDPNCSNSKVPDLNVLDHISYLDVNFTLLC